MKKIIVVFLAMFLFATTSFAENFSVYEGNTFITDDVVEMEIVGDKINYFTSTGKTGMISMKKSPRFLVNEIILKPENDIWKYSSDGGSTWKEMP